MKRHVAALLLSPLLVACAGEVIEGTSEALTGSSGGSSSSSSSAASDPTTGATGSAAGASSDTGLTDVSAGPTTEPGTASTAADGVCGDGALDPGEQCDDGDLDERDECTSKCAPPSCDDGLVSGTETDLDCGGGCVKCGGGATCGGAGDCLANSCDGVCAPVAASCLELLTMMPGLPNGAYGIDPGGDGGVLMVYCDMLGGGWTQVAREDLERPMGWSAGAGASCGAFTGLLGGVGQFGANAEAHKSFPLLGVPHSEARVVAGVIVIDSWDDERIFVELDGEEVASRVCNYLQPGTCNQDLHHCGHDFWKEGQFDLAGARAHVGDSVVVRLGSTLNEDANNESWALDTVTVFVK